MIIMSNNNIIQRKSKSILYKENKRMLGLGLLCWGGGLEGFGIRVGYCGLQI